MSEKSTEYIFWTQDPSILYENNNYLDFFPTHKMSNTEKLNAITRFSIYCGIFMIVSNKNIDLLYIPLGIIFVGMLIHYVNSNDPNRKNKNLQKIIEKKQQDAIQLQQFQEQLIPTDDDDTFSEEDKNDKTKSYEVEVGAIDANGNLTFVKENNEPKDKDMLNIYTIKEIKDAQKNSCRKPSSNNPFMNTLVDDYNNGNIPVACNAEDDEIHDNEVKYFNEDLYRDLEDLWDTKNSQRQWYTLPNTKVPNDQIDFAKWLYSSPSTCKENQINCLRYEDLRQKR